MDYAQSEIAVGHVFYDDAERGEVINLVDVLIVFGEFFVERINGFDAAGELKFDFFFV